MVEQATLSHSNSVGGSPTPPWAIVELIPQGK